MKNKSVRQMLVDLGKHIETVNGNYPCDSKWVCWVDGACLATKGGNFMWLSRDTEPVSVTAERMSEVK